MRRLVLVMLLCATTAFGQATKIREGSQTTGALPTAQGGMPSGGVTNDIPIKGSATDYNWTFSSLGALIDSVIGNAEGSIIFRNSSVWTILSPSTDGKKLTTHGVGASLTWEFGGTVTNTGGNLTSDAVVLGAGTVDTKVVSGITTDGTSQLNLGVNSTTAGKLKMYGVSSGNIVLQTQGIAGTGTVTLPNTSSALPVYPFQITYTGPTTARTKTIRDATDTFLELGGSYTPTGTWVWTSASVTWPTFNQNTSGSAATFTTARNLWGQSFNGSANIGGPIELGTAGSTATTLDGSAGAATIEGVTVATASNTITETNKIINPKVLDSNVPSSPVTPDIDTYDGFQYRGINAALTVNAPTGTINALKAKMFRFKDDGTGRALTFTTGANGFRAVAVAFPTTTVANKTTYLLVVGNVTDSRWDSLATGTEP